MSSEAGSGSSVLKSIRKLLGGEDIEIPEPGADGDDSTLVLTDGSAEAQGNDAKASATAADTAGAEDGDDLVLGPAMRRQKPADQKPVDTAAVFLSPDDADSLDLDLSDGDANSDARDAMFDLGLEHVGPSSVEFDDAYEADHLTREDDAIAQSGDPEDFDPAVWRPVFSGPGEGANVKEADETAIAQENSSLEETTEEFASQAGDNKLEGMPVPRKSKDDSAPETVSVDGGVIESETPDGPMAEEALEGAAADAPEDFQELLEDTVRRIIREELTGDLGQRMSQNIQKMIRDQVAQAVTSRG